MSIAVEYRIISIMEANISMEFIVHVIDEASQHRKKEDLGHFELLRGESEKGDSGDIIRSDHFYLIEEENAVDAVIAIANLIRVQGFNGEPVPISEMFMKTKTQTENVSIDDDSFISPQTSNLSVSNNTSSTLTKTSFQIERMGEEDKWIELHDVYFYVMPRENILFAK